MPKPKTLEQAHKERQKKKLMKEVKAEVMPVDGALTIDDKIKNFYLSGGNFELTQAEDDTRIKLWECWNLLLNYSPRQIVKMKRPQWKVSEARIYQLIQQAQGIFAPVGEMSKRARRNLQVEKYNRLIQKVQLNQDLEANDKYTLLVKLNERIDKISNLETDDMDAIDLKEVLKLPDIVLSTNPEVLKKIDAEDVPFEIVQDDSKK